MKTLASFSILLVFTLISVNSFSQNVKNADLPKNVSEYNKTERPMVVDSYQQPYIIKDKKLATYFKTGVIPASFPKYDYAITKKENIELVKVWLDTPGNMNLLSDTGKAKVAELEAEANN